MTSVYHLYDHLPVGLARGKQKMLFLAMALQIIWLLSLLLPPGVRVQIALAGAGLVALLLTLFSFQRTLLLLTFLIIALPIASYQYPPMPVSVSRPVILVLFLVILFYFTLELLTKERVGFVRTGLDLPLSLFLVWSLLCGFLGFLFGNPSKVIASELSVILLFTTYFLLVNSIRNPNWIRQFMWIAILATFVVFFEYMLIFGYNIRNLLFTTRVSPRQTIMFFAIPPFLLSFAIWQPSVLRRCLYLSVMIGIVFASLIAQTRAIWICLLIAFSVVFILSYSRKRKLIGWIFAVLALFFAVGIVVVFVRYRLSYQWVLTIIRRLSSLASPLTDPAVQQRIARTGAALAMIRTHPIIGCGIGASIYYFFLGLNRTTYWIDNWYLVTIMKMGLIGLALYLWILVNVFRRAFFVYRNSPDDFSKSIAIGTIAVFIGLAVWSLVNDMFTKYRFNMIWAILWANIEVLARDVEGK